MASRTPQPWRWLAACFAVIALLYAGVATGGSWTPRLGLDLQGGATAILKPSLPHGQKVTQAQLNQAVDVIRTRVNGIGVSEAEVSVIGGNIEVDVPGSSSNNLISLIGTTAQLRFRQVLTTIPVSATPAPSASATPSGTAAPTTSAGTTSAPATTTKAPATTTSSAPAVKPSPTSNGRALSDALTAAGATSGAAATTSAAPTTPTPTPTATASGATPSGSAAAATPTPTATQPAGPCPTINLTTNFPTGCTTGGQIQKQVTALGNCTKDKLNAVEALQLDDPAQPLAACARDGSQIYILAPSYMTGKDVKSASSMNDATQGWLVQLNFTGAGADHFGTLTTKVTSLASPLNQVAVVLDGVVESAPVIQQAITGGNAQITGGTGGFTQADTEALAQVLNFGSLDVTLTKETVAEISPTLGSDQLRGGLIAGGIGLGLVVLYSLLYYRGLGLVTVASLLVSALTTYASVTYLGGQIGYRLSLAGIAGFIVAVGITADSFVVYFERLRDEVREGRTLRSGAERAWVRARRTIISADTVSLLAAAILYWLSVGNVRGFAFTLGLSTITDLFVVFFFTKPLISVLAKTKLYGSGGKFSGLGRQRVLGTGGSANPAGPARPAPKEA
ncbi:MAG: preprotein translocase subunit SecD [Frankiales bacterium]|nr:preprotein translocase subunit SecD [Frankiales bacterium]